MPNNTLKKQATFLELPILSKNIAMWQLLNFCDVH